MRVFSLTGHGKIKKKIKIKLSVGFIYITERE